MFGLSAAEKLEKIIATHLKQATKARALAAKIEDEVQAVEQEIADKMAHSQTLQAAKARAIKFAQFIESHV